MSKRKRQHTSPKLKKICPRCKTFKVLSNFGKHKEGTLEEPGKIRTNSWCKECHREDAHKKRNEPGYKERNAEYMREYRKRVKDSIINR